MGWIIAFFAGRVKFCAIIPTVDTKKAIIIFILAVFLVFPSFAQFMDIPKGHEAQAAVQKLLLNKIIELSPSRKFNGSLAVDMYQLAFVLDRLLGYAGKLKEIEAQPLEQFYVDVAGGHYAHKAVRDLVKFGLFVVPDSKEFHGAAKLDRYTFYSYFAAFIESIEGKSLPAAPPGSGYADVKVGHPAYIYIQKLVGSGLLDGKGDLEGNKPMSRYEMAIFVAGFLDFYAREEVAENAEWMSYTDLPKGHFAHQAIDELVEVGILPPGEGRKLYGDDYINRYFLVDFISKIIEKIVVGEAGELPLASPARSYKDVSFSNFAYRSIQKLIDLGVIPAGNRQELFYGDRRINRYQMVFFTFSAIEYVLSDIMAFESADPDRGYMDVPRDHFVYETIQKLIWLGVLEGGENRRFNGEEFVTRYELCYFTVNFIKAIFLKLEEVKEVIYVKPPEYGFKTLLNTELSALQITNGKGEGKDLYDLSAYQGASIYIDRRLTNVFSAFASFSAGYNFGSSTAPTASLNESYLLYSKPPLVLMMGRTSIYDGFTPFGNSIFIDTFSDAVLTSYDHHLFALDSAIGKLVYTGDVALDSNFGIVSLTPRLPNFLSWMELRAGSSLITDLPDPSFTVTLPTRVVQSYGGIKIDLYDLFDLTAEFARLDFSDKDVLPTIGYSTKEGFEASQYSITYFSEDYGYSFSLGYQVIGDDYYLSTLADPASFLGAEQNSESVLFKSRFYPSPAQTVGVNLASVTQDNFNIKNVVSASYNVRLLQSAYLNLTAMKIMDNTQVHQDQLNLSSSFSVTF